MGIFFSKKKPPSRVTEHDKAVLQLKQQRDKLRQYQKRIELSLGKDKDIAKKLLNNGQRDRAKLLLKKKRYQEQLLSKLDVQLDNLDKMASDIEFAQLETQVVSGLKAGNEALKQINDSLKIEDIERILDETREGIDKQNEINELLSGQLTDEDEAAVEEELAGMIEQEMPSVPSEEPKVEVNEEESEDEEEVADKEKPKQKEKRKEERVAVMA
ncbi:charged multivesicular body protein 6-A [Diabrotica virgifera virgifera]|uniref:Charged multivesicular body protein 6-A n=1 Tax=Diabrotica virgifera virgifera TaxID=50390 RepID=A0A6P7GXF7_DIAVI|nr:charged multivesicular body protein 6-A [Diabrotica virgifera virgifera]